MNISISPQLKEACPGTALGILFYDAEAAASSSKLIGYFEDTIDDLSYKIKVEDIVKLPHVESTREAYKTLGKSPSEYRNAAEAMLRRIVKGKGLYHINNVVEINNLISVTSGYSIGSYDTGCLKGDVVLERAEDGAHYPGIGKSSVNIEHIPTLRDDEGLFGNPTSDSQRAMIQNGHRSVMSVIYSFDGAEGLKAPMDEYAKLLKQYIGIENVETLIVE